MIKLQIDRTKVLKNKIVQHEMLLKSKMCFFKKNKLFAKMWLQNRLLISMRLTTERNNLMQLGTGRYPLHGPEGTTSRITS